MLDDLWRLVDQAGRDRAAIDVVFGSATGGSPGSAGFNAAAHADGLAELRKLGVTWASVSLPGDSLDHAVEAIEQYGAEVIAPLRRNV
jgi:hypothetical protein